MTATILGDRDGTTFIPERDRIRLDGQALDVWSLMSDGQWHTASEIEARTGHNWAAASARIRDFRKPKFGGSTVERKCLGQGVFAYRLVPSEVMAGAA